MDDKKPTKTLVLDDDAGKLDPNKLNLHRSLDIELGPEEMWPDGKKRPHRVRTQDGSVVALTGEEFDQLVLAYRHQRNANKQGPRAQPRPDTLPGAHVTVHNESTNLTVAGRVLRVKNSKLVIEAPGMLFTIGCRARVGAQHYTVTAVGDLAVHLRLVIQ